MLKPFADRVRNTRMFLEVLLEAAMSKAEALQERKRAQQEAFLALDNAPVAWELDTNAVDALDFPGYEARYEWSNVTGERATEIRPRCSIHAQHRLPPHLQGESICSSPQRFCGAPSLAPCDRKAKGQWRPLLNCSKGHPDVARSGPYRSPLRAQQAIRRSPLPLHRSRQPFHGRSTTLCGRLGGSLGPGPPPGIWSKPYHLKPSMPSWLGISLTARSNKKSTSPPTFSRKQQKPS